MIGLITPTRSWQWYCEYGAPADQLHGNGDASHSYFVSALVDQGVPFNEAVKIIEDPVTLYLALQVRAVGLEAILADSHAASAFGRLLALRDPNMWGALASFVEENKPRHKPGPRRKDGQYTKDQIAQLRASGLSLGKIAEQIYGDRSKRNRVSATLSQNKKRTPTESTKTTGEVDR